MINVMKNNKGCVSSIKCQLCDSDDMSEHLLECGILHRLTLEEMKTVISDLVENMPELR